jgi:prophage regulatory protein
MSRRILRLPQVVAKTGDSKSTIRRKELAGVFPARVALGAHAVGWFEDEIDAYLEALPRKRPGNTREDLQPGVSP